MGFFRKCVQPYAPYPAAVTAGQKMDESYTRLAEYLNVNESEVHLGPSTSQNTYVLAQAMRAGWKEGDEIIVTNQDHEANNGVCWPSHTVRTLWLISIRWQKSVTSPRKITS